MFISNPCKLNVPFFFLPQQINIKWIFDKREVDNIKQKSKIIIIIFFKAQTLYHRN
jgi:hypothetical protein